MFSSTKITEQESALLLSARSTSEAVILTEREAFAFTTKFAQWAGGRIPKRDVQISQGFLAQRLSVINEDGKTTGESVFPEIRKQLIESNAILVQAPDGLLPEELRNKLAERAFTLIDEIVLNSRQIILDNQRDIDENLLESTNSNSRDRRNNFWTFLSFIILTSILTVWGFVSFRTQYSLAKKTLKDEEEALLIAENLLNKSESMVKKLTELDITKSDFISTVNHELRTPLTSIIGYIDVLKTLDMEKDADQLPQITTVIDRNSEVLLDIIESILSLSSLDSAGQIPRFEKTHLIEIIDRKIFVMTPSINQKALSVNFHHEQIDDFAILGNAGQISQVVLNLLSNAIKFSPNSAAIDIYLSLITKKSPNDFIRLEIKDHGIGIPQEEIPKLFTRFFRASNAVASQITGTGLGLSIVARILDIHQSTVHVESEVNKGSSFIVEFPKYVSEVKQHVSKNRSGVLYKAIVALKASPPEDLKEVCHRMGGTLGFYDLQTEMQLITDFQRWIESDPNATRDLVELKKVELVSALEDFYTALDDGMDRKR